MSIDNGFLFVSLFILNVEVMKVERRVYVRMLPFVLTRGGVPLRQHIRKSLRL